MEHAQLKPMAKLDATLESLRCLECGRESEHGARGLKALLGDGFEGDPVEVGIFCPDCATREFAL